MRHQQPRLGSMLPMFSTRFRLLDSNRYTMGNLVDPRSNRTGGLMDPFRTLRTTAQSTLKSGDVLVGADLRKYLIIDNGVAEMGGIDYKTYKVLELQHQDTLRQKQVVEDAITRQSVESYVDLTSIWYSIDPLRQVEDVLHVETSQYTLVTYYPVQVGWMLGNDIIRRVEKRLGIYQFWLLSADGPQSS